MIPEDVVIEGQHFLLVSAKGKAQTKFPKLTKTKKTTKTKPTQRSKESAEEKRKKEIELKELAQLIKKTKLSGGEKEDLEDLEKKYPNEAKALRAALPKGAKQVVVKTKEEKGQDFADSLTNEDEDEDEGEGDDEEGEDEEVEEKKEPKEEKKPPKPSKPSKPTKPSKRTKTQVSKEKQEGEGETEEKPKKRDVLKSLMNAQGDDEEVRGKRRGDEDDDEEEDVSERLDEARAKDKARSMFKGLSEDVDDDDEKTRKNKEEFQNSMVKTLEIGLDEDERKQKQHLQKKKQTLGLDSHEERQLARLNDKSSPMTQHYDDLDEDEQKEMRDKWVEERGKKLLQDNHDTFDLARKAGRGKELDKDDKARLQELVRENPEAAKAIFTSHGVDLSIPDEPDHPPSWKTFTNKAHLKGKDAEDAVVKYHALHEKSKHGDYEAQQELKKLKKVLDDPKNLDDEARSVLNKAGIKTKWNPDPEGKKNFDKEHGELVQRSQLQEDKLRRQKEEKERKKKEKEDEGKDRDLKPESILNRSHDDIVDQYHRLHYLSQSKSPKGKIAKKRLQKLQRVLDSKKLPKKLKDRLDKEGIPTKDNPKPSGGEVFSVKQWQKKRIDQMQREEQDKKKPKKDKDKDKTLPQEKKPEAPPISPKDEGNYKSVEDYHKNVGKCPPGYRRDEEAKKCVPRDDVKKEDMWKPQGGGGEGEKKEIDERNTVAEKGTNVAKAINMFDNLSLPSQKKILDHTASGTSALADNLHTEKDPAKKKGLLNILKRIGAALKPRLSFIFKSHGEKAKAVGAAIDKAHHVAVLGKDPKDWTPKAVSAKTVATAIDDIDKAKV